MKKWSALALILVLFSVPLYAAITTTIATPIALRTTILGLYNGDTHAIKVNIVYSFFTFDDSTIFIIPVNQAIIVQNKVTTIVRTPYQVSRILVDPNIGYTLKLTFAGDIAVAAYYINNGQFVPLTFTKF